MIIHTEPSLDLLLRWLTDALGDELRALVCTDHVKMAEAHGRAIELRIELEPMQIQTIESVQKGALEASGRRVSLAVDRVQVVLELLLNYGVGAISR